MPISGSSIRRGSLRNRPSSTQRSDDVPGSQSTEQPTVFKLQLRPLEEPESFKPTVQLVSREFATRYLESVGVRPSKATMELVNRNVPLTEAHIKTTLRAKGHVEDEIHISVPPVTHHYRVPVFITPAAVLQLGIGNSVLGPDGAAEHEGPQSVLAATTASSSGRPDHRPASRSSDNTASSSGGGAAAQVSRGPGGTDFLDMAARYLHPFNMDLTLARQNIAALYAVRRHKLYFGDDTRTTGGGGSVSSSLRRPSTTSAAQTGSCGSSLTASGRRAGSERGGRRPGSQPSREYGGLSYDPAKLEVLEELLQPLLVTPEVVLTLQAQLEAALADWHRHQAPEALKGRLTAEEFRRTQEELSSEGMVKLLITLVNFLHEELIRGHPAYPAHLEPRLSSREAARSSQGRRQESILGERGLLPGGGSAAADGGSAGSSRRSATGSATLRGGMQLPSNISIQQMTNLQKYDLGYQAYVRQKLEQRQTHGSSSAGGPRSLRSAETTMGYRSRSDSMGGDRLQTPYTPGQQHQQYPSQQQQQQQTGPSLTDTQRVSFAAAPHYNSLPSSPQHDSRPISPPQLPLRGPSSSLLGPLNLPGSRSGASSPAFNARRAISPASSSELDSSPIPGLPPRVGRALRHSPSFALASAASTARSIHASLDAADTAALQRERLFALHVEFASRFKALRQSRSGMFFTLPILLLAMRLCVNMLFSTLYPLWTRMPEGAETLEDMDAALRALFDPHGYLERALSLLQSTPSAIEAVTRHPQRRGTERQHFNDTSPLMQATLQGAKSAGARKLMKSSANQPPGRSLLRTQLTPEQRAALFQLGLQWMQQSDPVLSQIGEPQAVGRL
ncbi:hypothetical protein Agub_g1680 [Astrephomene gubernaculifera]|uniref:Uncharacterized protein n=1 Tax=Astrephomene gubernaculifera TaxID=47775 RepID=A0AAD3HHM9_9CHLO|nr:hypothetical protein Agub_g1680 [Astrephomene gubernaculifera]